MSRGSRVNERRTLERLHARRRVADWLTRNAALGQIAAGLRVDEERVRGGYSAAYYDALTSVADWRDLLRLRARERDEAWNGVPR